MEYGKVSRSETGAAVRFERLFTATQDRLWAALTNQDEISRWLAPCRLRQGEGGSILIDFGGDQQVSGTITEWEPTRRLAYRWIVTDALDSDVHWELRARGKSVEVVLEHSQLPVEHGHSYAAGWHAHLDSLSAYLEDGDAVDWEARFTMVLDAYRPD